MKPFALRTVHCLMKVLGAGSLLVWSFAQAEPAARSGGAHAHCHAPPPPASAPASDSLYQMQAVFRTEENQAFRLADLRGEPALVVMFYGTCKTLCPILVEDARAVDAALKDAERKHLRVILVTFDAERDTPDALEALAAARHLERPRWTLLRGSEEDVRELAMVLGVQYRKLKNGNYAHSAVLTLLDPEGRIAARIEGLRQPNTELVAKARGMID